MSSQRCCASEVPMESIRWSKFNTQRKIESMADRRTCQSSNRSRAVGLLLLDTHCWMHPRMAMSQQLPFGSVLAIERLFSARTFEAVVTVSSAAATSTTFRDDDATDLVVMLARCTDPFEGHL